MTEGIVKSLNIQMAGLYASLPGSCELLRVEGSFLGAPNPAVREKAGVFSPLFFVFFMVK
jgi:hypothetical protein